MTGRAPADAAALPAFEHVGLFFDRAEDAADRVAEAIDDDLRHERAVLLCLPAPLRDLVTDRIDPGGISILDETVRYGRPVDAMAALWSFADRSIRLGAQGAHSIGQIGYDGGDGDAQWHWYEAAVNDVFAASPVKATCLFDMRTIPPSVVTAACATHPVVHGLVGQAADASWSPASLRPRVPRPARPPDLHLAGLTAPARARAEVGRVAAHLERSLLDRAQLVVSECVTNAVIHGAGAADVDVWVDTAAITLEVGDDGDGIHDPFAALRPPQLPVRGAGLWICHLESSGFSVAPRVPHGTVVTARID